MSKKLGIIAAICCAFALCFALVGCGSSVDKSNYTGDWKLVSGSSDNLDADSVALMNSLGYEVTLKLNEEGTGLLDLFGDEQDVTWEASSNTEGTLTSEASGDYAMKLANSQLSLTDSEGESMTFER